MRPKKEKKPIGFCSNRKLFITLVFFITFWTVSSFDYYLITFLLKYIPGNIYVNTTISCLSEVVADIVSGWLMAVLGIRLSFLIAFVVGTAGGVMMIFLYNYNSAMAVFVLLSKFGIAFAFNTAYLATPMVFPVILTSTAFGLCNLIARFITIASPIIAELDNPIPMTAFSIAGVVGIACSLFVTDPRPKT